MRRRAPGATGSCSMATRTRNSPPTHLSSTASGEGYGLDIENDHFVASLSRQMGQLERLKLKREHGSSSSPAAKGTANRRASTGRTTTSTLEQLPEAADHELGGVPGLRGHPRPVVRTVRRWGFPHSPVHPVFTPSRMHMSSSTVSMPALPYFIKEGVDAGHPRPRRSTYLRDDEWVFSGYSFTDTLWMGADGKLRTGPVEKGAENDLWAVGFFNRVSRDAFIGLFLKHEAEGMPELTHTGAPTLHYRWHGQVWSRALFQNARLAAGGELRQKNAYLVAPFPELGGAAMVEGWRNRLLHPLAPGPGRVARRRGHRQRHAGASGRSRRQPHRQACVVAGAGRLQGRTTLHRRT